MTNFNYVNGEYLPDNVAQISINDRSFHFADAVYEVVAVYNNKLLFWNEHVDRLKLSLKHLNMVYKKSFDVLKIKCKELIQRNDLNEGLIYIHISRGISKRNHNWNLNITPSLVISSIRKKVFDISQKHISLIFEKDIRWKKCYIKSVSLLPNVLLKQKAFLNKAQECILLDKNGYITEATTSNIWILIKNNLVTTPLTSNILAGVTRKKILEIATNLKIKTVEKKFKIKDLYNADATFITNSSSIIQEANRLGNKKLNIDKSGMLNKLKDKMLYIIQNDK
ncbi:MAG: hypothetical protein CBE14_000620 [Rickettsiales bacterium TMED254]|nr:hypothetical protein [Rickettsiales bacterium]RPF77760.1 MAG: hypothetical protein CBE14_000620 [Rickettsiales bacterium TMED254]